MKFVALILGVLCIGGGALIFMAAPSITQQMLGGILGLAGVLWFVLAGVSDVADAIGKAAKERHEDAVKLYGSTNALREVVEQLKLDAGVIRKAKEVEHIRAKQAASGK